MKWKNIKKGLVVNPINDFALNGKFFKKTDIGTVVKISTLERTNRNKDVDFKILFLSEVISFRVKYKDMEKDSFFDVVF